MHSVENAKELGNDDINAIQGIWLHINSICNLEMQKESALCQHKCPRLRKFSKKNKIVFKLICNINRSVIDNQNNKKLVQGLTSELVNLLLSCSYIAHISNNFGRSSNFFSSRRATMEHCGIVNTVYFDRWCTSISPTQ